MVEEVDDSKVIAGAGLTKCSQCRIHVVVSLRRVTYCGKSRCL